MLKVSGLSLPDLNKSEHSEHVKKLFKYVADVSRKIEEKHQAADKVEDVFSLELLQLRTKLKEAAMKMLTLDPKKSGVKVLEYFWRKCFHEPYSVSRQLKGNGWSKTQIHLIQSHLLAGIGTYHNLILFLAEKFGWESEFLLDFTISKSYGWASFTDNNKKSSNSVNEETIDQAWVENNVFRCLVWLGDLSRYLETDLSTASPASATRYYQLASMLSPSSGQPYNNLAMLAGDNNQGLDQLYLYLKCVCCATATENGQANLKRLLDKPIEFGSDGRNLVSGLLQLVKIVLEGGDQEAVTASCQHSLAYLHSCLEAKDGVEDLSSSGPWLSLAVSVVILLVQHKAEPVCQAWLMAILSHLAGKICNNVLDQFPGLEIKETEEIAEEIKEVKEDPVKKRRNKLENMLRRRKAGQSGSEGDDSEESSDEIFESDDDFDEEEEEDDNSSDGFLIESSSEEDDDDDDVVVEEMSTANQSDVVMTSNQGGLLAAFILCQTWLRQHPHLLAQTGQGSEQMWKNLANLFTILCLQPRENLEEDEVVTNILDSLENTKNKYPLAEDWLIRGHSSEADQKLTWIHQSNNKLKENVLRLVRVAEFRDWLCQHQDSKITWDQEKRMARFKKAVAETDKKNVMKHMAELWLRQEVKDLEKETVQDGGVVIVDTQALVTNLTMVKRTLGMKKFTVIIPMVAVHQLDGLKKTERGAREAIRWLERELARGNKWLQAQKAEDKLPVEDQENNLTKHQLQLVQCLAYFVSRNGVNGVTFLTGNQDILNGDLEFLGEVRNDIRVENVDNFVPRVLGIADENGRSRKRGGGGKRRRRDKIG